MSSIQKGNIYEFSDHIEKIWKNIEVPYEKLVALLGYQIECTTMGTVMWFFHVTNPEVEELKQVSEKTLCVIWKRKTEDMKEFHIRAGDKYSLKYLESLGLRIKSYKGRSLL